MKAFLKKTRKLYLEQFKIAVAQVRNRIRQLGLQQEYMQEI
jgi:hypothetical protein